MRFSTAIWVIIFVLFCHALGIFWLYELWEEYDILMHLGGGVAMGCLGLAILDGQHLPRWVILLTAVGFVAIIGIGWEWYEYLSDTYWIWARERLGRAQTSIGDTMADLFFDLLGGLIVWFLVSLRDTRGH